LDAVTVSMALTTDLLLNNNMQLIHQ